MTSPHRSTASLIEELIRSTGAVDAPAAIRQQARGLIRQYVESFGEPDRPINVDVLASLRGIGRREERPVHSEDAELVPDGTGGVTAPKRDCDSAWGTRSATLFFPTTPRRPGAGPMPAFGTGTIPINFSNLFAT